MFWVVAEGRPVLSVLLVAERVDTGRGLMHVRVVKT